MNSTDLPDESAELDFQPATAEVKPHPWAVLTCRAWGIFCATLLAVSVLLQVRHLVLSPSPATTSQVVAWLCFDALFLLGAYAGYELLCDGNRCDD